MKTHTNDFKNQIKLQGRELESVITYTLNNEEVELRNENLNSVSPHYEGAILKSVMKQLDIDSNIDIPVGTVVNFKQGLKNKNVEQQITDIMLEGGSRFYEEFYYPNAGIDRIRRYINTGIKIDARNLMNTSYLTNQQKNFLHHNADLTQTKVAIYPYEPIGIEDYTINATAIPSVDAGEFEYLNFGNYIVYSSEKQEDTNSYKIICYDKMLYSMKEYEQFNTTYPITIREYINLLSQHLGLTFKNVNDTFPNYNKTIDIELFLNTDGQSIGYTFRDALDQLAEVTASTICINEETDELEIRYINETSDIIDEEYLKDINVNFGEMTKPINTIVLSRAGGSDKIYQSYPENLPEEERNAIEIADNQIMNFNNRDTFIPNILNKLLGLTYSLNDFSSTGILYYNLCDRYTVKIGGNNYSCIMFNDEVNITQGLEELVHTDLPEETVTDYTKADKTDRRINETYLIVDKQNQVISSVVTNITEQNTKISQLTQTVDELDSKIQDIADITTAGETSYGTLDLDNVNESEPVTVKIRPLSQNISYLYHSSSLFFSANTFYRTRTLRFTNNTNNTYIDYELPANLLYYDNTHYDEFLLSYDSHTCQVTKRCKYNADGSVGLLDSEQILTFDYPEILLQDGDYTITLLGYNIAYLSARLMAKNIYTSQFYTKVETDSHINQKASEIELGVNQTLTNYATTDAMNAAINIKANEINSTVRDTYATIATTNDLSTRITTNTSQITQNANSITAEVVRATDEEDSIKSLVQLKVDKNDNDQIVSMLNASADEINITSNRLKITSDNFILNANGHVTASSMDITGGSIDFTTSLGNVKVGKGTAGLITMNATSGGIVYDTVYGVGGWNFKKNGSYIARFLIASNNPYFQLNDSYGNKKVELKVNNSEGTLIVNDANDSGCFEINGNYAELRNSSGYTMIDLIGEYGYIDAYAFRNMSLAENKKDIELFNNALEEIKNTDIYKYNFKNENSKKNKHLGFVIGDGYNYPKSATTYDKNGKPNGADSYALASLCLQAIKEQQQQIEKLTQRIEELERESDK